MNGLVSFVSSVVPSHDVRRSCEPDKHSILTRLSPRPALFSAHAYQCDRMSRVHESREPQELMRSKKSSPVVTLLLGSEWARLYRSVSPKRVVAIAGLVAERRRKKELAAKGRQFTPRARAMWLRRYALEAMATVLIEKLNLTNNWFSFDPADRTRRQKAMVRGRAIYLLYEELKRPTRRGPKHKKPSFAYRPLIEGARARGRPRKYPTHPANLCSREWIGTEQACGRGAKAICFVICRN